MNKNLPKNIILPAFIGILTYIFLFLGTNAVSFSEYPIINWLVMVMGAIVLYATVIGAVNNFTNIEIGAVGYKLSSYLVGLILPLMLFTYNFFNRKETPVYKSLLEKEAISFRTNNLECSKIKYGTFTNGTDTIIRLFRNHKNYELTRSYDVETLYLIKWMDSCSYVTLKNGSVQDYVRLGNFENGIHYRYSKPGAYHKISDESYEMIMKID